MTRQRREMLEDAAWAVENDPKLIGREQWESSRRLWKMIMLAPTVEVLDALIAGEAVPIERLDPIWVARFGLRNQDAA